MAFHDALILSLWILFLNYQVVKVTILFIPMLIISLSLCCLSPDLRVRGYSVHLGMLIFFQHRQIVWCTKMVLHDCNSRFTSRFWKALWELLGNKIHYTSAYYPQTDGQLGRENHTIKQTLRCLFIELNLKQSKWVVIFPFVEFFIKLSM